MEKIKAPTAPLPIISNTSYSNTNVTEVWGVVGAFSSLKLGKKWMGIIRYFKFSIAITPNLNNTF